MNNIVRETPREVQIVLEIIHGVQYMWSRLPYSHVIASSWEIESKSSALRTIIDYYLVHDRLYFHMKQYMARVNADE